MQKVYSTQKGLKSSKNRHLIEKKDEKKPKKKRRWLRITLIIIGVLIITSILFVGGVFAYFAKDLPSPGKINKRFVAESTKIYDRSGDHLLYDIHGEEKRTIIPYSEIPDVVKQATIALEDQSFYEHHGIQFTAILRAAIKNVVGGDVKQGGSTITQQLIKNTILTNEKTFTRKIKEVILSLEIEQKFTKDEILEMYLNEIPYGSNAYGIEAGAQTFFGKHASELSADEAALLASLPKAPTYYSPYGTKRERLKGRQEAALNNMQELGFLSEEETENAKNVDIYQKITPNRENISAPHFTIYVREQLEEKYGEEFLQNGGLKVYTTLDWDLQQTGERVVHDGAMKNVEKWDAENAALVAIDPQTGQILTMVGSRDFFDEEIDGQVNVALSERQPGSSFKPYVYLENYRKGYTPETILYDTEVNFAVDGQDDYKPQNYDGTFRGPIKMKKSLAQSLNIPAVKSLYLAETKEVIQLVKRLGITSLNDPDRYGLSLVLGGGEVRLLDHVAAFSVLANDGVKHEKTAILRIEDKNGKIIEEYQETDGEEIVEKEHITMLNESLSINKHRAPAFGEQNPLKFDDRTVAGKTGTTNEFRDGWTMGYTPSIAVGVWAGNNDNRKMRDGAAGANVASPIWRAFLNEAIEKFPADTFDEYKEEETGKDVLDGKDKEPKKIEVCEIPGEDDKYCRANKYCPEDKQKKRAFADKHNILHYVDRSDPRGDEPEEPKNDPQYKAWEKGVKAFYKDQDKTIFDEKPEDECKEDDFSKYKPSIELVSPSEVKTNEIKIETKTEVPYGIEKIEFIIDGKVIESKKNENASIKYSIPDSLNNKKVLIEVILTDKIGNTTKAEKNTRITF